MTKRDEPFEPLAARAEKLAGDGDWSGLHAELSGLDEERILSSPALAYRFGETLYHTGRMRELSAYADGYIEAARSASDTPGIMRALNLAGIAAFELGEIDAAEAHWEELLELADGVADHDMLARAANNLGAVANLRGHSVQAVVFYRLALLLYQRLGQARGLAQTHHNVGVSLRDVGRYDDAIAAFDRAIEVAEGISYRPVVAMTWISRAELEVRRADFAVGAALATRGLNVARELGDPISEGEALRVRGVARGLSGEDAGGVAEVQSALGLARSTGNKLLEAESLRDLGELELAAGRSGASPIEQALACFGELGASGEIERLRARLAEIEEAS